MIGISRCQKYGQMAVNGTRSDISPFHFHGNFFQNTKSREDEQNKENSFLITIN